MDEATLPPTKKYGAECPKHPWLEGLRWRCNHVCVRCSAEQKKERRKQLALTNKRLREENARLKAEDEKRRIEEVRRVWGLDKK